MGKGRREAERGQLQLSGLRVRGSYGMGRKSGYVWEVELLGLAGSVVPLNV